MNQIIPKKFIIALLLLIVGILSLLISKISLKELFNQIRGTRYLDHKPKEYINHCEGKPINLSDVIGNWTLVPIDIPENVNIIIPELVLKTDGSFIFKGWKSNDFISNGVITKINISNSFSLDFNDNIEYWEKFVKSSLKENSAKLEDNKAKFLVDISQFSYPDGTCQYRFWLWGWQFEQISKIN